MENSYRRIVLEARPVGMPKESDFRMEEAPMPEIAEGQVRVRNIFLSVDPYMRGRMRDVESYAPPVKVGEVMVGGTVGVVVESRDPAFVAGEFVQAMFGWQEYGVSEGKALRKLDAGVAPVSTALGVLGMPGMTAYFCLLDIGRPKAGETVVVSGAAGAVGGLVGQIAKIKNCRAVGIAGGPAKCDYIVKELGFDAAIDYKAGGDLRAEVAAACPDGVDVYFDNVGGVVSDAVMLNINLRARIPICGQISQYNNEAPETGPRLTWQLIPKRARMEGFLVTDYADRWGEGVKAMSGWLAEGKLTNKEQIVTGLENAPMALMGLLTGANTGKQLVQLGDMPD